MKAEKRSFIQFEEGEAPLTISGNLQQPVSHFGRAYIELNFGERERDYFKAECYHPNKPEYSNWLQKGVSPSFISIILDKARRPELRVPVGKTGTKNHNTLPPRAEETPEIEALTNSNKTDWWTIGVHNLSKRLQNIDISELEVEAGKLGYKTTWYRNHAGALDFYLLNAENQTIMPHFYIIESYRLTSFPTRYGTGRTIKNLTLMPGEKTRITISTFSHEKDENSGSCLLDSNNADSAQEFQNCVEGENQSRQEYINTMGFITSTEVDQALFSCNVPVNNTIHINLARKEFIKNFWKALTKHCTRASSRRIININSETAPDSMTERYISREITNPNHGKTVNYIFRQLNQEYLTLLSLTDIRIGYSNGMTFREYTLPELDRMLEEFTFNDMHDEVRTSIINTIMSIHDWRNETIRDKNIIQFTEGGCGTGNGYYQFSDAFETSYKDETSGLEISLPGIIMSSNRFIMPTASILADTIVGQGDLLDTHIRGMQNEELRERVLNNDMKEREVEKLNLAESIVKDTVPEKAKIFEEVFAKFDNNNWG